MVRGQARDLGEPPPSTLADAGDAARGEDRRAVPRRARRWVAARPGARADERAGRWPGSATAYGIAFQHADDIDDAEHGEHAAAARDRLAALIADAIASRSRRSVRAPIALVELARALGRPSIVSGRAARLRAVVIAWRLHASGRADPLVRSAGGASGRKARPRVPRRAGGRERRRDVQDRRRQDRHRPRREGADPRWSTTASRASTRRSSARATRSCWRTWGRRTAPSATACKRRRASELVDGDKILVGSTTILKFTLPRQAGRDVPAPDVRVGAARRPDQGLQQEATSPTGSRASSRTPSATRRRCR